MTYDVIIATDVMALVEKVNRALKEGYELWGSIAVAWSEDGNHLYVQPVMKGESQWEAIKVPLQSLSDKS